MKKKQIILRCMWAVASGDLYNYSVVRKTRRWTLRIFYGLLDQSSGVDVIRTWRYCLRTVSSVFDARKLKKDLPAEGFASLSVMCWDQKRRRRGQRQKNLRLSVEVANRNEPYVRGKADVICVHIWKLQQFKLAARDATCWRDLRTNTFCVVTAT